MQLFTVSVLLVAICSCEGINIRPGAEPVVLRSSTDVAECELLGTTTGKARNKWSTSSAGMKVIIEVRNMARNEAARIGGNVLVEKTELVNSRQTFWVYNCLKQAVVMAVEVEDTETLASSVVNSATIDVSGTVSDIYISRDANDQLAVLYITGLKTAGKCKVSKSTGLVIVRILNSDQGRSMYSAALEAYMAGMEIKVRLDDGKRDSMGVCYVEEFRLNKSF
jgi:hypothetical protein